MKHQSFQFKPDCSCYSLRAIWVESRTKSSTCKTVSLQI